MALAVDRTINLAGRTVVVRSASVVVASLTAGGTPRWHKVLSQPRGTMSVRLLADKNGVVVAGRRSTPKHTASAHFGTVPFIVRLDSNGTEQWATVMAGRLWIASLAALPNPNMVAIVGTLFGSATIGGRKVASKGRTDIVAATLSMNDGKLVSVNPSGISGVDGGVAVTTDRRGAAYHLGSAVRSVPGTFAAGKKVAIGLLIHTGPSGTVRWMKPVGLGAPVHSTRVFAMSARKGGGVAVLANSGRAWYVAEYSVTGEEVSKTGIPGPCRHMVASAISPGFYVGCGNAKAASPLVRIFPGRIPY